MNERLRVLHVIRSGGFAGVEKHVALLAGEQARLGDQVTIVGGMTDRMVVEAANPAVRVVPAATVAEAVRRIGEFRQCDVLHVHMTAAELAGTLAVSASRVPVVATRHFAAVRGASLAGRMIAPMIRRRVAAQIAISHYVADHVDGPATVIHPGVPTVGGAPSSADRQPCILVAQRLEREKRTDVTVRAFAASGLASGGWRLEIAGTGSQAGNLASLAEQLGVARSVRLLGFRSDIDLLMRRASLLLAPCDIEGLGLTVLEAMAVALPVVLAGAGAHLELVEDVPDAALFRPDDIEQAGALLAVLADDPSRRDRYGSQLQQAQRTHFTLAAQGEATQQLYESLR